jgi:hypothetical protein
MTTQQPGPSRSAPPQELSFPVTEPVWPGEVEQAMYDDGYRAHDGHPVTAAPGSFVPTARNPVQRPAPWSADRMPPDVQSGQAPPEQPPPAAYAPQPRQGDSVPGTARPTAAPGAGVQPRHEAVPVDARGTVSGSIDTSAAFPPGFGEPIPYRRKGRARRRRETATAAPSRATVSALVTGAVLTLLSLAALVFAAVDLVTVATALSGGDDLSAEQSAQVDSAMRELGLSPAGTLRFYFVLAVVGAALALVGSVLVVFADRLGNVLRNVAPAAIAGGGAVLVAAAVLLMPSIPVGRTGGGPAPTVGFPLLYLVIGVLLLLAGIAALCRPIARRLGLSGSDTGDGGGGDVAQPAPRVPTGVAPGPHQPVGFPAPGRRRTSGHDQAGYDQVGRAPTVG